MKIDVTKIDGYADMTPEQKLAALEAYDVPDLSSEVERYKNAASKANSEAADWKRKHNALLSEEDKKKKEDKEKFESLEKEVATLRKEKQISSHKAQFMGMGYDEALATETATAMVEGNTDLVFANQKKFLENHDKTIKADMFKQTPRPPAGNGGSAAVDYQTKANEAMAKGNISEAAYYTRLAQQHINK